MIHGVIERFLCLKVPPIFIGRVVYRNLSGEQAYSLCNL